MRRKADRRVDRLSGWGKPGVKTVAKAMRATCRSRLVLAVALASSAGHCASTRGYDALTVGAWSSARRDVLGVSPAEFTSACRALLKDPRRPVGVEVWKDDLARYELPAAIVGARPTMIGFWKDSLTFAWAGLFGRVDRMLRVRLVEEEVDFEWVPRVV